MFSAPFRLCAQEAKKDAEGNLEEEAQEQEEVEVDEVLKEEMDTVRAAREGGIIIHASNADLHRSILRSPGAFTS